MSKIQTLVIGSVFVLDLISLIFKTVQCSSSNYNGEEESLIVVRFRVV